MDYRLLYITHCASTDMEMSMTQSDYYCVLVALMDKA